MMKRLSTYAIGFLLASCLGLFIWRKLTKPDDEKIKQRTPWVTASETSNPSNYTSLIAQDKNDNRSFLLHEAVKSILIDKHFPYFTREFNIDQTHRILEVLNDFTSYSWGEFGSFTGDKTIVFYGKNLDEIGYTHIDLVGEVESYPYRSLMKWGMLSETGFKKLMKEINNI